MDVFPLLLTLFVLPGWQALDPMPVTVEDGVATLERHTGVGREVHTGDVATVHYSLADDGGGSLIDTVKRGMPFSFALDGTNDDSPLVQAVQGMRRGGSRVVFLPSEKFGKVQGGLVPPGSELILTVKLMSSWSLPSQSQRTAKVNSKDAERAQRAMEISRIARNHGSTRAKDPL